MDGYPELLDLCRPQQQGSTTTMIDDIERIVESIFDSDPSLAQDDSECVVEHDPSLRFYRGQDAVKVVVPPCVAESEAADHPDRDVAMREGVPLHVMDLHQLLLPPHISFDDDAERLADDNGLRLFEQNFDSLRSLLFPSVTERRPPSSASSSSSSSSDPPPHRTIPFHPFAWQKLTRDGFLMDRLHYSYTVLLHYFGWRLHNEETGELDRHRNWRQRYAALERSDAVYRWYPEWTRMLRVLLELRMPNYAYRFLLFLVEEFAAGRLLFLRSVLDSVWLPMVEGCNGMSKDSKKLLRKKLHKLDNSSDSD